MSGDHVRGVAVTLDESRTRIQTIAELLLLSCSPKPVFNAAKDLQHNSDSYITFRDKVIAQLNKVLLLTRDIATQVHGQHIQMRQLCSRVKEMSAAVISLSELTAHIAYLMALTFPEVTPATAGPVTSVHQLTTADLDLRFCCTRLKRSRMNDLQPSVLVDMCSSLTKSITVMSELCRQAAEKTPDANDQDQFKLCVKTITSTTGCLVSSIKSFKHSSSETHLRRVMTFCDPVTAASSALLTFATEQSFTGQAAILPKEATELYKSVIGLAMSIASASVQMCKAVRDLVYSSSTKRHRDRISLCVESVTRSAGQLRDFLLGYQYQINGESQLKLGQNNVDVKSRDKKSGKHSSSAMKNSDTSGNRKPAKDSTKNSHSRDLHSHNDDLQTLPDETNSNADDSPDNADDSGICEEKSTIYQSKNSAQSSENVGLSPVASPVSSSRPTSAVIDNMFACQEEKSFPGVDGVSMVSSTSSLVSDTDMDSVSTRRLSLGLTTESSHPLEEMSEKAVFLKSQDI